MDNKHGGNIHEVRRMQGSMEIIDFSANINPLGISEKCKKTIIDSIDDLIHYPDPDYFDLKQSIGAYHNIDQERIVLGNGAIDCIFQIAEFMNVEEALILAPTFIEYERAFLRNGTKVKRHNLSLGRGFKLDADAFIKDLTGSVGAAVICNPNNPTGQVVPRADMMRIMDHCEAKGIYLVIDEAFMEFIDDEDADSMVDRLEDFDNLIILRSLTKFFAIPGLRLGYFLTANQGIVDAAQRYRIPWTINTIAANLAVEALKDREYISEARAYIKKEREWLYGELDKIEGLTVFEPTANYIFFKVEKAMDLKALMLEEGIMIRHCANYYNLDESYYRVAVKERSLNEKLIEVLNGMMG